MRTSRRSPKKAMRPSPFVALRATPHVVEGLHHVVGRRTFDFHGGVPPPRPMQLLNAGRPLAADADAAGDPDASIDDEELAVVARNDAEPTAKAGRIEHGDIDAAAFDSLDEAPRCPARADPIEEQADLHATTCRLEQCVAEPLADVVRAKDVALEGNAGGRLCNELEHRV